MPSPRTEAASVTHLRRQWRTQRHHRCDRSYVRGPRSRGIRAATVCSLRKPWRKFTVVRGHVLQEVADRNRIAGWTGWTDAKNARRRRPAGTQLRGDGGRTAGRPSKELVAHPDREEAADRARVVERVVRD